MTLGRVTLESFDADSAGPAPESSDFRRGFAAGKAAAAKENDADQTRALSGIAATLSDMSFGFTEARLHLIEALRPVLAQVAEVALPQIIKDSFGAHLTEVILRDFDLTATAPVRVMVAPQLVEALNEAMPPEITARFTFESDDLLAEGQAILRQADTHIMIDLSSLTQALQQALLGLETLERTSTYG